MNKAHVSTPKQVHTSVFKLALDYNSDERETCQQFTHILSGMVIYYVLSVHFCKALQCPSESIRKVPEIRSIPAQN